MKDKEPFFWPGEWRLVAKKTAIVACWVFFFPLSCNLSDAENRGDFLQTFPISLLPYLIVTAIISPLSGILQVRWDKRKRAKQRGLRTHQVDLSAA